MNNFESPGRTRVVLSSITFSKVSSDEVYKITSEELKRGKAIGWMQGRMEFGPRALGGRSILADPRSRFMQKQLNLKIKFSRRLKKFEIGVSYFYNSWKKSEDYDKNGVDNLDEATIDGTPSWQILNLDYRLNINENLISSFSLENIFDAHYKTFGSGISASGRNFVVSLTSKF